MRTVKFRDPLLGIRRLDGKSRQTDESQFFKIPDESANIGEVVYCGPSLEADFLGKTVYFGAPLMEIRINGAPIQILEGKNVFATVEESAPESPQTN